VNYPLAPKDIKQIKALQEQYQTPDTLLSLIQGFAADGYGMKIEPIADNIGFWKVVVYNLTPVKEGDNHSYYISGESSSLCGALFFVRYKVSSMVRADLANCESAPNKSEYR